MMTDQEFKEWLADMWGEVYEQYRLAEAMANRDASEDYAPTPQQADRIADVLTALDMALRAIDQAGK